MEKAPPASLLPAGISVHQRSSGRAERPEETYLAPFRSLVQRDGPNLRHAGCRDVLRPSCRERRSTGLPPADGRARSRYRRGSAAADFPRTSALRGRRLPLQHVHAGRRQPAFVVGKALAQLIASRLEITAKPLVVGGAGAPHFPARRRAGLVNRLRGRRRGERTEKNNRDCTNEHLYLPRRHRPSGANRMVAATARGSIMVRRRDDNNRWRITRTGVPAIVMSGRSNATRSEAFIKP